MIDEFQEPCESTSGNTWSTVAPPGKQVASGESKHQPVVSGETVLHDSRKGDKRWLQQLKRQKHYGVHWTEDRRHPVNIQKENAEAQIAWCGVSGFNLQGLRLKNYPTEFRT
jgi:hypothetical protein